MAKKNTPFNNPFAGLKLPETPKAPAQSPARPSAPAARKGAAAAEDEARLFLEAVGAVEPVKKGKDRAPAPAPPPASAFRVVDPEVEALTQLSELVTGEGPMDLASSDEYIEGAAPGLDVRIVRRLRAGDYSFQAHLDLHGLTRDEAKAALEQFVHSARLKGHRCVLVVTGRGLHSKDQIPVLKESVQAWLSRGRVARQVLAFTSARPQDGGVGAVYVLLRR